jgi:hypothetical protein
MKALIFNNKVVDVQNTAFDVAPTMTWVDCGDTVEKGFSYNPSDGSFTTHHISSSDKKTITDSKKKYRDAAVTGNQKLLNLGLTQDEATALTGYKPA